MSATQPRPARAPRHDRRGRFRRAGNGTRRRMWSTRSRRSAAARSPDQAGAVVELGDQLVPRRDHGPELPPPRLLATRLELLDAQPLLLDPREVSEVEDPVAFDRVELTQVV